MEIIQVKKVAVQEQKMIQKGGLEKAGILLSPSGDVNNFGLFSEERDNSCGTSDLHLEVLSGGHLGGGSWR